jgi:hypothetical protein
VSTHQRHAAVLIVRHTHLHDVAARWEFDYKDDYKEWGTVSVEQQHLELQSYEWGHATAVLQGTNNLAWMQTDMFNLPVVDTTHIVVRMWHRVAAKTAVMWIRTAPPNGTERTVDWLPGTFIQQAVEIVNDNSWAQYAFPVENLRAHVPSSSNALLQLRLFPATNLPIEEASVGVVDMHKSYGSVHPGNVDIDYIRVVNAPTITRIDGCMRVDGPKMAAYQSLSLTTKLNGITYRDRPAQQYFENSTMYDAKLQPSFNDGLPFSTTYGCHPNGGETIIIQGFHFGTRVPTIMIGDNACQAVIQLESQQKVQCVTPPAAAPSQRFQSLSWALVRVINAEHVTLEDAEPALSYSLWSSTLRIRVSNVNAMTFDVNIIHGDAWSSIVTTGYEVEWIAVTSSTSNIVTAAMAKCSSGDSSCGHLQFSNTSVLTINGLLPAVMYAVRVCALADHTASMDKWVDTANRYFQRPALSTARCFMVSDTAVVTTLHFDFVFARFTAAALLDRRATYAAASYNSLQWAGGEGQYGLSLVGTASIANCNATHSCCDNYGGQDFVERLINFTTASGIGPQPTSAVFVYNPSSLDFDPSSAIQEVRWITKQLDSLPASTQQAGLLWNLASRAQYTARQRWYGWEGMDDTEAFDLVSTAMIAQKDAAARVPLTRPLNFTDVVAYFKSLEARALYKVPAYHTGSSGRALFGFDPNPLTTCQSVCYRALSPDMGINSQKVSKFIPQAVDGGFSTLSFDTNITYNASSLIDSIANHQISGRLPMQLDGSTSGFSNGIRVDNGSTTATTVGATAPCGPALRLTSSLAEQAGAAWYPRPQQVLEGFDTTFVLRLANPSTACPGDQSFDPNCRSRGAGGIAFVLNGNGPLELGKGGSASMGYEGLQNAISVELDTKYDETLQDPYENHVSVQFRNPAGRTSSSHYHSVGHAPLPSDLTHGIHTVRIVYEPRLDESLILHPSFVMTGPAFIDAFTSTNTTLQWDYFGTLSIFYDNPLEPVLIVPCNLQRMLDLTRTFGRAYVGFTASTGVENWQTHDILAWHFTQLRRAV